jgi:hypothetical protein
MANPEAPRPARGRALQNGFLLASLLAGIVVGTLLPGMWSNAAGLREVSGPSDATSVGQQPPAGTDLALGIADGAPAIALGEGAVPGAPGDDREQVSAMASQLAALGAELARVQQRLSALEQTRNAASPAAVSEQPGQEDAAAEVLPTDTAEDQRYALVTAGVDPGLALDIVERRSRVELARLELRDRATREGWRRGERYRSELQALNAAGVDLREEVGDLVFDRYLYDTGATNRVRVTSVVSGSAGEQSGLLPGDVIESYDDRRIFAGTELRDATTRGTRDEMVPVQVRRGDTLFELWLPRGPIGIRMVPARVPPLP